MPGAKGGVNVDKACLRLAIFFARQKGSDISSVLNPNVPNWQSVRARVAYGAGSLEALSRLVRSNLQAGAVVLTLARRCASDWVNSDGRIAPPSQVQRCSSINGIASSLDRPFETIRRHVQWLIECNLVIRTPEGIALASDGLRQAEIASYLQNRYEHLGQLIRHLVAAEDMFAGPAPDLIRRIPAISLLETAIDIDLAPFEFNKTLLSNLEITTVYSGIAVAGTRAIQADPEASARYRFANTPDHLRQSVSLRSIAQQFSMDYATVWRYAQKLKADGLLTRVSSQGWAVRTSDLHQDELYAASEKYFQYLRRILRGLVADGFDPHASWVELRPCDTDCRERQLFNLPSAAPRQLSVSPSLIES